MPCKISDCAQMSKTIIAVRHFGLGGHESLETAVIVFELMLLEMQTVKPIFCKTDIQNFADVIQLKKMLVESLKNLKLASI